MNLHLHHALRRSAALLALLALLVPNAAALHEPLVRVSLSPQPQVQLAPPERSVEHVVSDLVATATAPLSPPRQTPTATDPPAPSAQAARTAQAAEPASPLPWALLAGGLLLLAGLVTLAWVALARRRARRESRELREKLALSRLAAGASIRRGARLARLNAELREELAAARRASAPPGVRPDAT